METLKNYFSQSHFASVQEIMQQQENDQLKDKVNMFNALIISALVISILVLGFMAVPHLCPENTERGKNTRLGLYFLLLITGGQIGWLYILLWLVSINICL